MAADCALAVRGVRFEDFEARVVVVEARLDVFEARADFTEVRFDVLDARVAVEVPRFAAVEVRFAAPARLGAAFRACPRAFARDGPACLRDCVAFFAICTSSLFSDDAIGELVLVAAR